ncbi:MAG: HAD family hydrolase [Saprospiraceae bacterium]|nr:HAD family hydrolase [Saprospiraceae bacterium]
MKTKIGYSRPNFKPGVDWTLFLDRDGVINERLPGEYVRNWEEFRFLPGVLDALGILSNMFYRIFIVTNQAGIEKGVMSHNDLHQIHNSMMEYIIFHGGRVDEIYYCPFKGDLEPLCRKPNPGMALEAKKDYPDIKFQTSVMVGDSSSDIIFGNRLGMKTVLVGNKSDNNFNNVLSLPDSRMDSLYDFASYFQLLYQ